MTSWSAVKCSTTELWTRLYQGYAKIILILKSRRLNSNTSVSAKEEYIQDDPELCQALETKLLEQYIMKQVYEYKSLFNQT